MYDYGREPRRWDGFNPEVSVRGCISVAAGMGQKRTEDLEAEGRPICRHARTKVWFREKSRGNHAQAQTFTTPWGSAGDSDCSSSKWHDPPSTPSDTECRRFDEGIITRPTPNCESRGPASRASSRHERRIYLQLNLKNRESPQLVVCPERNHHQATVTSRESTVIDVDDLPMPSRPPSRSRLSEPALSSSSSFARIRHQGGHSKPVQLLSHETQQQSLRQAHQGSGHLSSTSDKVPSPTASSISPRQVSLAQFHAHEEAMSATHWSCSELDLRYNLAFRPHDDDEQIHHSHPGVGEVTGEFHGAARDGWCGAEITSLVALPKRPHGVCPGCHMVKIAAPRRSSIRMKSDVPLRVKGGSGTPHSELEPPGQEYPAPVEISSMSLPPTEGVVLSWEGLTVTSKGGKVLLDDLNGQITSGFTAIMGPSGSGKSTLLNTLACRMGQSASIEGRILLNGRHYKIADLKKMSGYVMQDDLLNAHLTVEETLKYTTRLKLEPSLTEDEVYSRVDSIIKQMGLDHVRGTVIGSPDKRGISGGERKRVCVGMELLTHPELLFLDEPTSGLDSVTALSLCEQLQELSSTGHCTIVCTIHQPQAKIFNLFHYLIILKAGQVIYQGKASEVLRFFEESGFPCPEYTNPADHFLDVITPSLDKARDSLRQTDHVLKSKFHALPVNMSQGSEYSVFQTTRERMPWHRQYTVLLNRGVREQIRKKNVLITHLCQSMLCALLIGGVFFQIGNNQSSTVRRQPVLFFCVINQGVFGALSVINSFPGERVLTLRERAAGMYYCSSYFMAKITAEMASQIISPVLFSCIVYWMVGFQRSGSKFMIFMVLMVLCQLAATSLALMVSALCRTTDLSVTVLPMVLEVNRLFGGFFLSPKSLPNYFAWLDALSYVKYTYTAISLNELHGLTIRCDPREYVNGKCPITSGQQTISNLGLDYINIGSCVTILIFYILITRVVAYLGIRYLKK